LAYGKGKQKVRETNSDRLLEGAACLMSVLRNVPALVKYAGYYGERGSEEFVHITNLIEGEE